MPSSFRGLEPWLASLVQRATAEESGDEGRPWYRLPSVGGLAVVRIEGDEVLPEWLGIENPAGACSEGESESRTDEEVNSTAKVAESRTETDRKSAKAAKTQTETDRKSAKAAKTQTETD